MKEPRCWNSAVFRTWESVADTRCLPGSYSSEMSSQSLGLERHVAHTCIGSPENPSQAWPPLSETFTP